jgi:hypothetical protein
MYARPVFQKLSMELEQSSCCWVYVNDTAVNTGLCAGQESFVACQVAGFCSVSASVAGNSVAVSGYAGG